MSTQATIRPTKRDPSNLMTLSALSWLETACDALQRHRETMILGYKTHGHPLVATGWPKPLADKLAEYLSTYLEHIDHARTCWKRSGRSYDVFTLMMYIVARQMKGLP